MSQKPWKIRTTTTPTQALPGFALLCCRSWAGHRAGGIGRPLGHWDGRPSSIQLPCNLFVRTVSLELLKAWLKIIRFPTRLESEHTWHIWYILILGKSDVMQKSNPSPRLRVVPSPFWEGPSQMPSPSSNENWPISKTSPIVTIPTPLQHSETVNTHILPESCSHPEIASNEHCVWWQWSEKRN